MIRSREAYSTRGGQVMIAVVTMFLFVSVSFLVGISDPILRHNYETESFLDSRRSYVLAEGAVEDVVYKIKNNKQIFASDTLSLDGGLVNIVVVENAGVKTISVSGSYRNLVRNLTAGVRTGVGSSFHYGIQAGAGGFSINNNAIVYGNVYSNGPINGGSNARVTGSATSASSSPSGSSIDELLVGTDGSGDADAYTITDSDVEGGLYCRVGSGNNKYCDASKPIPSPAELPITEPNIDKWRNDATDGGIINGNYTIAGSSSFGPKKIVGNLTVVNNKTLTLIGTLWVTGDIILGENSGIRLSPAYGANSGVIITDGRIDVSNNVVVSGSGQPGSYLLLLTTSDCPRSGSCDGEYAIDASNNVSAIVFNAQNGSIRMDNNSSVKEVTAYEVILKANASVNYESGLANVNFISGPSGGWNVSSWQETE